LKFTPGTAKARDGGSEGYRESKFDIRKLNNTLQGLGVFFQGVPR